MLHNWLHLAPGTMDGTWYQVQWHSLRMVAKNESHKLRIKGPDFHSTSVMRHLSSVNQLKTSGAENSNQTAGKCAKSGDWNAQVCCPHSQTKLSMCSLCSCNVVHKLGLHLAMFRHWHHLQLTWHESCKPQLWNNVFCLSEMQKVVPLSMFSVKLKGSNHNLVVSPIFAPFSSTKPPCFPRDIQRNTWPSLSPVWFACQQHTLVVFSFEEFLFSSFSLTFGPYFLCSCSCKKTRKHDSEHFPCFPAPEEAWLRSE